MSEKEEVKAGCEADVRSGGAAAERAKRTLVHYFSMIAKAADIELGSDCLTEIEEAVDDIVESAVLEARARP